MKELTVTEMQAMQRELYERYRDTWQPLEPPNARNQLLWMVGEVGEMIDLIKKLGDEAIARPGDVRAAFVEEMVDVLMYLNDVALCYGVGGGEIADTYRAKHAKNMRRSYEREADALREKLENHSETI